MLCCAVQADTLDDAIALVNANPYGNGTAIFTDSGSAARRFQHDVQVCVPTLGWMGGRKDGWEEGWVGGWMRRLLGVCGARLIREDPPLVWARAGIGSSSCQGEV